LEILAASFNAFHLNKSQPLLLGKKPLGNLSVLCLSYR
jgi:hypothetical protein